MKTGFDSKSSLRGVCAVPAKRSAHFTKGVLIGAMSTLALALVMLLVFLWIWFLSKKERASRKYTEVKKQVHREQSKLDAVKISALILTFY